MFDYENEYGEWHQACDVCVYNHSLPGDVPFTDYKDHYPKKPDLSVWIHWKLKDKSRTEWRNEHPDEVEKMKRHLGEAK